MNSLLLPSCVVLLLATHVALPTQPRAVWPAAGWSRMSPASQGLDPQRLQTLHQEIAGGVYGHVDHLLVVRNGHLVFDERYPRDYRAISRGRKTAIGCGEGCDDPGAMHEFNYLHPNWHPYYQGRDLHTLQSVTKSIAATVIGIAIGRGEVANVRLPFLTMRSGIEWHETDRPMDDNNTTIQLEKSQDWIQFTLDQPMDAAPGTKWTYNSGGSQLLSGIIRTSTGRFIDEYAAERLFRPLGIKDFHWKKTPTGHPDTEGGLYLSAGDLARIGLLYLRHGMWNGTRILPEGWVRSATTPHVNGLPGGWDYGYQWWLMRRNGAEVWAGRGFGGQSLIVIPSRDIVAVVHAWNVFGSGGRPIFEPLMGVLLN